MPPNWGMPMRRGGLQVGVALRRSAVENVRQLIESTSAELDSTLGEPTDQTLLADRESPTYYAALGRALGHVAPRSCSVQPGSVADVSQFVDALVLTRGLPFTATVLLEMAGLLWRGGPPWVGNDPRHMYLARLDDDVDRRWAAACDGFHDVEGWWIKIRNVIATVPDEVYVQTLAAVRPYRERLFAQRFRATYLMPSEREWVREDVELMRGGAGDWRVLVSAVDATADLDLILGRARLAGHAFRYFDTVAALVDGLRADAVPYLARQNTELRASLWGLAMIPTDEAFDSIAARLDDVTVIQQAALDAAERFPRRALRILGQRASTATGARRMAAELFRLHVLRHPDLLDDAAEPMRGAGHRVLAERQVPVAEPEDVPGLLAQPPWDDPRRAERPPVVSGLAAPQWQTEVRWQIGEQREFLEARPKGPYLDVRTRETWDKAVRDCIDGRLRDFEAIELFVLGPVGQTRSLFVGWTPQSTYYVDRYLRPLAARYGLDALPHVMSAIRRLPQVYGPALLPFVSPDIAALTAEWLAYTKSARVVAAAWLQRHAESAAVALVPAALGKPGRERTAAETALRSLDPVVVRAAAQSYGDEAGGAIKQLLSLDPLYVLPGRPPKLGEWFDPTLVPPVLVSRRTTRLDDAHVRTLATMLALSRPGEPYAGLAKVLPRLDADSLSKFAWSAFEQWQIAGLPATDDWALTALGLLGDDDVALWLASHVMRWPGEKGSARAAKGVDVLADHGSDAALSALVAISQRSRFRALKLKAAATVDVLAAERGLLPEQLADRCVPRLGLDENGGRTLDFGAREFTVSLDDELQAVLTDASGRVLRRLPRPNANDDPERAGAARRELTAFTKELRAVVPREAQRLELAMITRRTWSGREFRDVMLAHPVLGRHASCLIWTANGVAFRPERGDSLRDAEGRAIYVDDAADVRLAHPLDMSDAQAWSQALHAAGIRQPFVQLDREVFRDPSLLSWTGIAVPIGRVLSLEKRGWPRGRAGDSAVIDHIYRPLPDGRSLALVISPGIQPFAPAAGDTLEMKLERLGWARGDGFPDEDSVDLAELDPILASEVARDLTYLMTG